jgi:hypothetical protein
MLTLNSDIHSTVTRENTKEEVLAPFQSTVLKEKTIE